MSDAIGRRRNLDIAGSVLIAASAFLVYARTAWHGFVLIDDDVYLTANDMMQRGLSVETAMWAFAVPGNLGLWHPLTVLSMLLDVSLFGLEFPGGHHLMSLAYHGLAGIVLFFALSRMTAAPAASLVVALLFTVHPLHVESVAWASERKDVLSGVFFSLTLLAYAWYARKGRAIRYLLVLAFHACGLMAKASVVTMPALLLLLDVWPLGRARIGAWGKPGAPAAARALFWRVVEKLPLLMLSLGAVFVGILAQNQVGALPGTEAVPLKARLLNAVHGYGAYLSKTFWPFDLAVFYPHPYVQSPDILTSYRYWGGAALILFLLIIITGLSIWQCRRRPYLLTGWLWFLGVLFPMIGLIQIGGFAYADRHTYLPLTGLFIALVWWGRDGFSGARGANVMAATAAAFVIVLLGVRAFDQAGVWRDTETLSRHALQAAGESEPMLNNLGIALYEQGRFPEAIACYRKAISLDPGDATFRSNLGNALAAVGEQDEALIAFEEALRLDPSNTNARFSLGKLQITLGAYDAARANFEGLAAEDPQDIEVLMILASLHARRGSGAEAIKIYERILAARPEFVPGLFNYGNALRQVGELDAAAAAFRKVLKHAPQHSGARTNLGIVLMQQGAIPAAIEQFEAAVQQNPSDAEAHYNLGVAREQAGHYESALTSYETAIRLDEAHAGADTGILRIRDTRIHNSH